MPPTSVLNTLWDNDIRDILLTDTSNRINTLSATLAQENETTYMNINNSKGYTGDFQSNTAPPFTVTYSASSHCRRRQQYDCDNADEANTRKQLILHDDACVRCDELYTELYKYSSDQKKCVLDCAHAGKVRNNNDCKDPENQQDCDTITTTQGSTNFKVFKDGRCQKPTSREDCLGSGKILKSGWCRAPNSHTECKSLDARRAYLDGTECRAPETNKECNTMDAHRPLLKFGICEAPSSNDDCTTATPYFSDAKWDQSGVRACRNATYAYTIRSSSQRQGVPVNPGLDGGERVRACALACRDDSEAFVVDTKTGICLCEKNKNCTRPPVEPDNKFVLYDRYLIRDTQSSTHPYCHNPKSTRDCKVSTKKLPCLSPHAVCANTSLRRTPAIAKKRNSKTVRA